MLAYPLKYFLPYTSSPRIIVEAIIRAELYIDYRILWLSQYSTSQTMAYSLRVLFWMLLYIEFNSQLCQTSLYIFFIKCNVVLILIFTGDRHTCTAPVFSVKPQRLPYASPVSGSARVSASASRIRIVPGLLLHRRIEFHLKSVAEHLIVCCDTAQIEELIRHHQYLRATIRIIQLLDGICFPLMPCFALILTLALTRSATSFLNS